MRQRRERARDNDEGPPGSWSGGPSVSVRPPRPASSQVGRWPRGRKLGPWWRTTSPRGCSGIAGLPRATSTGAGGAPGPVVDASESPPPRFRSVLRHRRHPASVARNPPRLRIRRTLSGPALLGCEVSPSASRCRPTDGACTPCSLGTATRLLRADPVEVGRHRPRFGCAPFASGSLQLRRVRASSVD